MRIIVAVLVILVGSTSAFADRAQSIAQDLQLSPAIGSRVVSTLATYDAELYKLRTERADIRRELLVEHTDSMNQTLLDNMIANAQALVVLDQGLLASLRQLLPPDQIVRVFTMLDASEPEAPHMIAPPVHSGPIHKHGDRCNPFEQPHRCPT